MTKTILLGMTAEEIVEKMEGASPEEVREFGELIDSMDNHEEIKKEIREVLFAKVKREIQKEREKTLSLEDKFTLDFIDVLVQSLEAAVNAEEAEDVKEEQDLVSMLRNQMAKPKVSLVDELKAQLEPKESLADILRKQMEPKKTLTELLKEQVESKEATVTKEDIISEIIEGILETELEEEEMVLGNNAGGYGIAIGLTFAAACAQKGVRYEADKEDVEYILSSVVNGLIEKGRKVEIRMETNGLVTVIR